LWAGAGSALLAPSALAGSIDNDNGTLGGLFSNATPYTFTKVAEGSPVSCTFNETPTSQCWISPAADTIPPGGSTSFILLPNVFQRPGRGTPGYKFGYDAWVTYRVDVLGGPSEYVTVTVTDCYCTGGYGSGLPSINVWTTAGGPPSSYDPAVPPGNPPFGLANPQVTYSHNLPALYDQTFAVAGNYTVDASTNLGQPFVDLLNTLCSGKDNTTCSFTPTAPVTYGPGELGSKQSANNCDLSAAAPGGQPSAGEGDAPPDDDPNYYSVEYSAAQSASLSAGGGITVSAEFKLFGSIASEAAVTVEAEHEWEEVKTATREAKVYIPSNSWGFIWVAPTVGRITGTLVATIGSATFTATNFTEVRSGVTGTADPLKQPTPAFNVVTKTRPMTAAEKTQFCGAASSSRLRGRQALRRSPPARLRVGRSVGHVALGDTHAAVLARLGWPAEKRFELKPCKGMQGCAAVPGAGGTWKYKKRGLSVVFDPGGRVAALIHRGNERTNDGVGKGSTIAHLRGEFPRISCRKDRHRVDCTVKRLSGGQTIRTVFRLTDRLRGEGTRWKTNEVLIYVERRGQVTR
jgi:hypothetical protein